MLEILQNAVTVVGSLVVLAVGVPLLLGLLYVSALMLACLAGSAREVVQEAWKRGWDRKGKK